HILEYYEAIVRVTETEIAGMEQEIKARRGQPNPYSDLNAAEARKDELYFELLRGENLRWRRR
ncbi:MAG: hypothetical protein ACYS47_18750, partial [Planctomycetota bacterium]